ncbi:MAG: hypothetical protein LBS00_00290 [Synergistaceae bacterium]|jgi:hypothetical protein|nr:hypothetical protein [Synergistaceae bacterium]
MPNAEKAGQDAVSYGLPNRMEGTVERIMERTMEGAMKWSFWKRTGTVYCR